MKRPTRSQLERRVLELEAQAAVRYHYSSRALVNASRDRMMASGVLVQLSGLNNRELVPPFVIRDGFSPELIAALNEDIRYSYKLATMVTP